MWPSNTIVYSIPIYKDRISNKCAGKKLIDRTNISHVIIVGIVYCTICVYGLNEFPLGE